MIKSVAAPKRENINFFTAFCMSENCIIGNINYKLIVLYVIEKNCKSIISKYKMPTHRIRERRKKNLLKNCILLLCLSFLVPIGIFLSTFFIDIQLIDKPYSTVLYDTHHEEI